MSSKQRYSAEHSDYDYIMEKSVTSILINSEIKVLSRSELGGLVSRKEIPKDVGIPRKVLLGEKSRVKQEYV